MDPDSLLAESEGLLRDVMTPHHPKYNSDGEGSVAPTDFDEWIAVALRWRLGVFVGGTARLELDRRISEHGADEDEDDERHPARDVEEIELAFGDGAVDDDRGLMAIHPPDVVKFAA